MYDSLYHKNIGSVLKNCSVIPLQGVGMGRAAKKPRIGAWKEYQTRKPTDEELAAWGEMQAYGIILGKVSGNIFGIDIDRNVKKWQKKLLREFPESRKTIWVRTRRGVHILFRYADETTTVATEVFADGDILGEGSYIVGPHSVIENEEGRWEYKVIRGEQIVTLEQTELTRLKELLGKKKHVEEWENTQKTGRRKSAEEIATEYRKAAQPGNRNKALYRSSIEARRSGLSPEQVGQMLIQLHVEAEAPRGHIRETEERRIKEAWATINSAYKRQRREAPKKAQKGVMPNEIRESLLKLHARENKQGKWVGGSTIQARLIESLIKEFAEEQAITAKQVEQVGQRYGIGERDVWEALQGKYAHTHEKTYLIARIEKNPLVGDVDKDTQNNYEKFLTDYKQQFGCLGRPPERFYIVPTLAYLADALGISFYHETSDTLSDSDLSSASKYRRSLFKQFLLRGNNNQSTAYLASIWSCHPRTIQRFDSDVELIKRPRISKYVLSMKNIHGIDIFPPSLRDGVSPGLWLERNGKKYPAVKGLALKLIKEAKGTVSLCKLEGVERSIGENQDFAGMPVYSVMKLKLKDDWDDRYKSLPSKPIKPIFTSKPNVGLDFALHLIRGLGHARINRLNELGVETLSQLIEKGSELGRRYWAGGYVTEKTVENWVEQAEVLLGRREVSDLEKHRLETRFEQSQYRGRYKKTLKFLEEFSDLAFDYTQLGRQISRLQRQWRDSVEIGTDFYLPQKKQRLGSIVLEVLGELEKYCFGMCCKDSDWLVRWNFESLNVWKRKWHRSKSLQEIWRRGEG